MNKTVKNWLYFILILFLVSGCIYGLFVSSWNWIQIIFSVAIALFLTFKTENFIEEKIGYPLFMFFFAVTSIGLGYGCNHWYSMFLFLIVFFEVYILKPFGENTDWMKPDCFKDWGRYFNILFWLLIFNLVFSASIWLSNEAEKREKEEQRIDLLKDQIYEKVVYTVVDTWEEVQGCQHNVYTVRHLVLDNGADVYYDSSIPNLFRTQKGHKVKVKWKDNNESRYKEIVKFKNLSL